LAIPDAVQNEKGRVITMTAYKKGTTTVQDITGATITGIIETTPGPTFTVRAVNGALAVVLGTAGTFTWTWNQTDTGTAGKFSVQFIATIGSTIIYKSFPEPWEVVRSPATPS
jgi:hypothetical protein